MPTLKEEAQAYQPQQTLNIADLDKVDIQVMEVKRDTNTGKDGEPFTFLFVELDGKRYRVPNIVIGGIKAILEKKPDQQYISVIKSGTGLGTTYQVIQI